MKSDKNINKRPQISETRLAEINDKLFTLLQGITPRQFTWLQGLQKHEFNPATPEEDVLPLVVEALKAGIRSSVARLLIEDRLRAHGIEFDVKKINARAHAAKTYWNDLGTAKHPEPPPLE